MTATSSSRMLAGCSPEEALAFATFGVWPDGVGDRPPDGSVPARLAVRLDSALLVDILELRLARLLWLRMAAGTREIRRAMETHATFCRPKLIVSFCARLRSSISVRNRSGKALSRSVTQRRSAWPSYST